MLTRHQLVQRVRLALLAALLTGGAAAVGRSFMPRKFAAEVTLAAIGPNRGALGGLSGSLALLGASQGGVSASPAMVRSILQSRRVAERVSREVYGRIPTEKEFKAFRRLIQVSVSRETGLIGVSIDHRDSAFARHTTLMLIDEVTAAFTEISRAQGRQQRAALEERVDSAARQLARAEESLQSFSASNRVIGVFSERTLEQSRRARNVQTAQAVYQQAVSDRSAATARELELAPAVVVVDPLPERLPSAPQRTALIAALAFVAALCLVLLYFAVRDQLAAGDIEGESGAVSARRA